MVVEKTKKTVRSVKNQSQIDRSKKNTNPQVKHETWQRRNNSNQISGVLNTNLLISNRSKLKTNKTEINYKCRCMKSTCIECYCNKKQQVAKNIPDSLKVPSTIIPPARNKSSERKINIKNESTHSLLSAGTLEYAKEIIDYTPRSRFLQRLQSEARLLPQKFTCNRNCSRVESASEFKDNIVNDLEYTDRRAVIEELRKYDFGYNGTGFCTKCTACNKDGVGARETNALRKYECCCNGTGFCTKCTACNKDGVGARETNALRKYECCCNGTGFCTKCTACNKDGDGANDINEFRRDNYFDCHSSTNLTDNIKIPLHTCVHKYTVNDRLFLEPLNVDEFCKSRCAICNIPLVGKSDFEQRPVHVLENFEWEYVKKREVLKKRLGECFTEQEIEIKVPVDILKKDDLIVAQMQPKFVRRLKSNGRFRIEVPKVSQKRIVPDNSLALRFQKGIVNL